MLARLGARKEVIDTANLSADRPMDAVSKWPIITRAAVFSMTLTSGLIRGDAGHRGRAQGGPLWLPRAGRLRPRRRPRREQHHQRLLRSRGRHRHRRLRAGAAAIGWIGRWVAIVVLGIPRLVSVLRAYAKPKPDSPPGSYVGWPLWFVGASFMHTRRAGALLVLGLFLNIVLPIRLPWLRG